jgi:hypothetical protein
MPLSLRGESSAAAARPDSRPSSTRSLWRLDQTPPGPAAAMTAELPLCPERGASGRQDRRRCFARDCDDPAHRCSRRRIGRAGIALRRGRPVVAQQISKREPNPTSWRRRRCPGPRLLQRQSGCSRHRRRRRRSRASSKAGTPRAALLAAADAGEAGVTWTRAGRDEPRRPRRRGRRAPCRASLAPARDALRSRRVLHRLRSAHERERVRARYARMGSR